MTTEIQDNRVPVTLLTGFLGAGKTSLLNHLIRDPEAGRIAVVMNEFGEVGLDHDLIEEVTDEVVLLQSGCLCCSIRGDLGKTLASLIARRMNGDLSFDRVVIETTGIAEPGPILQTLVVDGVIAPHYRMDGVVTLADAATGPHTLDTQVEAVSQIAVADLIVLSKSDLVTPAELEAFEARLAGINERARRLHADRGRVPADALFGLSAMHAGVTPEEVSAWLGTVAPSPPSPHQDHAHHGHGHHHHSHGDHAHHGHVHHDDQFVSASIEVETPIPPSVFDFWIDTLIAIKGPNILRIKGIVHVEDMTWPFVFHGVQHIFDAPVPLKSWSGEDKTSRVVVIARDMDAADLRASLDTLLMRPAEVDTQVDGMMADATEMPF